jgi:hypothetical protein
VTIEATSVCIPFSFPCDEGRQIKEAENHNEEFKKIFQERMRTSKCFTTDGSKIEDKPFVGFASIDIKDGRSRKFRIAKISSTFTAEALAIGETLEIIEKKIDSEQNFMIFLDSAIELEGISNSSTMNNISHSSQMLKDKIETLESRGKKSNFAGSRGYAVLKLMRGLTQRQSNQSKVEIVITSGRS